MTNAQQQPIAGIHHVTALAGEPQENVDFYTAVLGLRLVKRTVNFDDPGTYHLYYGDDVGHPGTILTFFPWPGGARGKRGAGQATVTAFRIPRAAVSYWQERFDRLGVEVEKTERRFDQDVITLLDPDGLTLELVAVDEADQFEPWTDSLVPEQHAIRAFHGVTLSEADLNRTSRFLDHVMGFRLVRESGGRRRFQAGSGGAAATIDLVHEPDAGFGHVAVGTVHHVAWRVESDQEQHLWRDHLAASGVPVTPVVDRQYFRSIYFREPGGVLFEIATDAPGFEIDEPRDRLGSALRLPPWLERDRERIVKALPELTSTGSLSS